MHTRYFCAQKKLQGFYLAGVIYTFENSSADQIGTKILLLHFFSLTYFSVPCSCNLKTFVTRPPFFSYLKLEPRATPTCKRCSMLSHVSVLWLLLWKLPNIWYQIIITVFFKKKYQTFVGLSFLNVRIYCFSVIFKWRVVRLRAGGWTKEAMCRCHFWLWESVMSIFTNFDILKTTWLIDHKTNC